MNAKTIICALLCVLVVSAAGFAAGQREAGQTAAVQTSPPGTFPIVIGEPVTISGFVRGRHAVTDYQDNAFTHFLEEEANVRLELQVSPYGQDTMQIVNVLLASGDYPDVFIGVGFTKAQQLLYGQQGVFLALNEMIEEFGVNTQKVLDQWPLVERNFTLPDGNIYALPDVNECFHCQTMQKLWIYEPWLDELGLEMPTTTQEFKDVMIAFRDRDPNRTGRQDQIPLAGAISGWMVGIDGFFMNSFIYTDGNLADFGPSPRLFVDNGQVRAAYAASEWRDGLAYLNDLYEEGLILPDSFVQDENQLMQLGENPGPAILGAAPAGVSFIFTELYGDSERWKEYVAVPALEGPGGVRYSRYFPTWGSPQWTITDRAAYPEVALRLGDMFYDEEVTLRNTYGIEGVHWRWAEPGEIGMNGKPATHYAFEPDAGLGADEGRHFWNQAGPLNRTVDWHMGKPPSRPDDFELILYEETFEKTHPYIPDDSMVLPPLSFDTDVAAEYTELQTALQSYVDEMIVRFITGDADLNTQWNSYLSELDRIGLRRYLEITQRAYDASGF